MPETAIIYIVLPSAASFASALALWLLSRPAAARARAERGWMYLEAGRWQFFDLVMSYLMPAFFLAIYFSGSSQTASDGILSNICIIIFSLYAVWKSSEVCFTIIRWSNMRICKTGVFSRARCLEFHDLSSIDVVEGGEATLRFRQGEHLKLDSRLRGAPELIETCRRHIAANTAATANSPGSAPTPAPG